LRSNFILYISALQPKATFFPLVWLKMQLLVSRDNYRKCLITSSCRICYVFASHRLTFIGSKGKVVTHSVCVGGLTYWRAIFFLFFTNKRDACQHRIYDVYQEIFFSNVYFSNKVCFFVFKKRLTVQLRQNIIEFNVWFLYTVMCIFTLTKCLDSWSIKTFTNKNYNKYSLIPHNA